MEWFSNATSHDDGLSINIWLSQGKLVRWIIDKARSKHLIEKPTDIIVLVDWCSYRAAIIWIYGLSW